MSEQTKKLLFEIVSVGFKTLPKPDSDSDLNTITVTAAYPSAGKTALSACKVFKDADDLAKLAFAGDDPRKDPNREKKILFKDEFCGDSFFSVECVFVDNPSAFEAFLGTLFKNALPQILKFWVGGFASVFAGDSVLSVGKEVANRIDPKAAKVFAIGKTAFPFNPASVPAGGHLDLPLTLHVERDQKVKKSRQLGGAHPHEETWEEIVVPAGDNGNLLLRVTDVS
jgi:hypothetical protein